jgi:hypothetical protein
MNLNISKLLLILGLLLLTVSCVNINKTAEQRLEELNTEFDVDLDKVEFYVEATSANGIIQIKVTPSSPLQNSAKAKEMLSSVWHQIAKEDCNGDYTGEPESTIIAVKNTGFRNMAMKVLLKEYHGEAICANS